MIAYKVVAATFELVSKNVNKPNMIFTKGVYMRDNYHITYNKQQILLDVLNEHRGWIISSSKPTEYYESIFINYPLVDLRNVMYLLTMFFTNYMNMNNNNDNSECFTNISEQIQLNLKYIEKSIKLQNRNTCNNL